MAQFFAYVFSERGGFRVVVEGIADVHARTLRDADRKAREIIRRAVFASHPDRDPQPSATAAALLELELRVVRVRAKARRPGAGRPDERA